MNKKIGLIGNNINYSISPIIHNYWIKKLNIKATYNKIDISEDKFNKENLSKYINEGYIGFNITIPYKEKILLFVDEISSIANEIKASNTIYFKDNKLIADNTDFYGFLFSLIISNNYKKNINQTINLNDINKEFYLLDNNKIIYFFKQNTNVLVIGAGGAAKAVIYSLLKTNVETIYVVNRTHERILNLKRIFKTTKIKIINNLSELNNISLVVNCTPITNNDYFNFQYNTIVNHNCIFYDIIYNPIKTNFLLKAESYGYQIINGTQMLIIQAAFSFYKWFNFLPSIDKTLVSLVNKSILNNYYDNNRYNR